MAAEGAKGSILHKRPMNSDPKCHVPQVVGSADDKFVQCPKDCPIWAENRDNGLNCDFLCVEATPKACHEVNRFEPVPDMERGICRACIIDGCDVCTTDGQDTCAKCQPNFKLVDGKCQNMNMPYWYALFAFIGAINLFIIVWIVDICGRPLANAEGLKHALAARSRAKLRMPKREGQEGRELWPLNTNMLKEPNVAGVGLQLQFNFFAATIVWGLAVAIAWLILALAVDDALFILGTRRAMTARQNCILVAWGFETQHRLMWTKVDFVVIVYIGSFIATMLHGVRQLRIFQRVDLANSTHKDFAARIRNLPIVQGTEPVEEQLKERIQQATGKKVVGVSVCWDFQEHEDDVRDLIESQLVEREEKMMPTPINPHGDLQDPYGFFAKMERNLLLMAAAGKVVPKGEMTAEEKAQAEAAEEEGEMPEVKEVDVVDILETIVTCPDAYAIFETEDDRDAAVDTAMAAGGVEYKGNVLSLNASRVEPSSVNWSNCANTDIWVKFQRILGGMLFVAAGLTLWVVVFYLPYAWFSLTFNYSYGQEPGFAAGMTFSMVVVAGNLMMYEVCSEVADNVRFIYVDDREVCYMLLFCFACVFNVVLDLVCTYYVCYRINVGLHIHTYDGRLLGNLRSFTGKFESYAMQRQLAMNLWAYAFPSTFLLPFIIEPVATLYMPYKFLTMIMATQPQIRGFTAERLLEQGILGTVFDLSRYADILLNIMIAVGILFFPGGFNIQMFLALAGSHCFVYAMDQYRILRSIKACYYADRMVDWWSQWILGIPIALVLSCFVFKANCEPGYYCIHEAELVWAMAGAFFFHVGLHTICLLTVVPKFGITGKSDNSAAETYRSCSERLASSWFSTNPMFCLRSQFFYKHSPPCTFCTPGKEHMIERNEAVGLYFTDTPAKAEDYDEPAYDMDAIHAEVSHHSTKLTSSLKSFVPLKKSEEKLEETPEPAAAPVFAAPVQEKEEKPEEKQQKKKKGGGSPYHYSSGSQGGGKGHGKY
eukprot:TRINITY_DN669_c0_g3_i2.p1 TRINITY_DN669_c0_g3~~TRINITY_DN669_c0_g3_i2.p1  ORF type:complete len:1064 (+),score=238.65 TRINITY_DN669_c0_g3_i2:205-3192(+)